MKKRLFFIYLSLDPDNNVKRALNHYWLKESFRHDWSTPLCPEGDFIRVSVQCLLIDAENDFHCNWFGIAIPVPSGKKVRSRVFTHLKLGHLSTRSYTEVNIYWPQVTCTIFVYNKRTGLLIKQDNT